MSLVTDDKVDDSSKPDRSTIIVRSGFSLFLLFHLLCAVIAPNRGAYPLNLVTKVVDVYSGLTGFWASWGFFAPDPGPQVTIEYEIYDTQGASINKGVWPELQTGFFKADRNLRRISSTQFMTFMHPEAVGNMLIPYLCRREAKANSVRLVSAIYSFPKITEIVEGKRTFNDDIDTRRKVLTYDFCATASAPISPDKKPETTTESKVSTKTDSKVGV